MTLAIDVMNGYSLSNNTFHEHLPKKKKVTLHLAIDFKMHKKHCTYNSSKIESFSFKVSGHACSSAYVTGFGKTDRIVTFRISRNTDLKH